MWMETLDSPAKRLKWARENRSSFTTASAAARAYGWPVPTYLGHENGDRIPSRAAAMRYAAAYKISWAWLLEGGPSPALDPTRHVAAQTDPQQPPARALASPTVLPASSDMPRDLPILGTVSGGVGGLQHMNGDAVDWARRPPRLVGRADVFGLYVEDQSMVPAFRPGALVIVERLRPPAPGDDVVVEILPANPKEERRALIKRLVAINSRIVRLEQYNPARELEFPRAQVASIHRVMTMADVLGI